MEKAAADGGCSRFTVAIVGGGFAGAVVAAQLLRHSNASVILMEKSARVGKGVAYGTRCAGHLLNVPAKSMTAFPEDPEHFLRWTRANHDPGANPGDFVPRQLYGRYVTAVLQHEAGLHPGRLQLVQGEALSLERSGEGAEIRLRSGQVLTADRIVLAQGNFPPSDPRLPGKTPHSLRYVSNPWTASALTEVAQEKDILLIGSGLTSVDIGISLRAQGFAGTIHVLSRRGLLPLIHKPTTPWPAFWNQQSPRTPSGLLRLIRRQVEAAERQGSDWRAVVDSLRPFTQQIWNSLSAQGKRSFLRHARPYWEVHRHRVAPQIGARLAEELMSGGTRIYAGRIQEFIEDADGVAVTYLDRKAGARQRLRVDRVINCTGPESDCRRSDDPLLRSLIRNQIARPDELRLGLEAAANGALIDAHGAASDFLYTIGPARKGSLWETTAVPEIRVQALELAKSLRGANRERPLENADSASGAGLHAALL